MRVEVSDQITPGRDALGRDRSASDVEGYESTIRRTKPRLGGLPTRATIEKAHTAQTREEHHRRDALWDRREVEGQMHNN